MNRELKQVCTMLSASILLSSLCTIQRSVYGQDAAARLQEHDRSQERRLWEYAKKIKNSSLAFRRGNRETAWQILEQTDIRNRGWEYYFLSHQIEDAAVHDADSGQETKFTAVQTLDDIASWRGIQLATCTADGQQVVVVPSQGLLKQIDLSTLEVASNFDRNPSQISYANATFDGLSLVTCDRQQVVKVWNADTLQQREVTYSGYYGSAGPNAIAVSPDGALVAFADQQRINFFVEGEQQPQRVLPSGVGSGMPLSFSPDGQTLAACSGGTVRIFEVVSGALVRTISISEKRINDLTWTADGKCLLAGTIDGRASLWDVTTGESQLLLEGHTQPVTSVAFNHDENRILTASADGSWRVWDGKYGIELLSFFDFNSPVQSVRFSRDGSSIVALTEQGVLTVHSAGQPVEEQLVKKIENPRGRILAAAVSPDQRLIAGSELYTVPNTRTGGKHIRGAVHIWSNQGEIQREITPRSPLNYLTFSRDSKRLIGCHYNVIEFWNVEDGASIRAIPGFPAEIKSIDIRPDGKQIAVATAGRSRWNPKTKKNEPVSPGKLSVCTLSKGGEIRSVEAHESTVRRVVYAGHGGTLVTLGDDERVKIWDPENLEQLYALDYATQGPADIASRPANPNEVVVARAGYIDSIDVSTGQTTRSMQFDTDARSQLAFSPDGKQLVTTALGQTLVLWDFDQGTELKRLKATSSTINALRATPHSKSFEVVACTGLWNDGGEVVIWQIP